MFANVKYTDKENENIKKFVDFANINKFQFPVWWTNELSLKLLYTADHKIQEALEFIK